MSSHFPFTFEQRVAPSRPYRLGTRRRKPRQGVSALPEAGASRSPERRAPSLDTGNHLATTCRNWLKEQETDFDKYQNRVRLWRQLLGTVHKLWQDAAAAPRKDDEQRWWIAYDEQRASIREGENREYDKFLLKRRQKVADEPAAYITALYLEAWKKRNPPPGQAGEALRWEKQYFQLLNCEGEWIGKAAKCCGDKTRAVAIPIGCNHRLCPLCAWRRSEGAQRKTKKLFDRLTHPQFITLTTPNLKSISKRSFNFYRKKVTQFIKGHPEMFLGGVYAIETTYNRVEKTWHLHAHALVDGTFALPAKEQRIDFAGRNMPAFTYLKLALEFDWSRMWCKALPKKPRKNANVDTLLGERFDFETWVRSCFANRLKVWNAKRGEWMPIQGLSAEEMQRRTDWNAANRRVMWIKPVDDRERAAKEVLKYITKCADFCDDSTAVKLFYDATRGARLMQTFGSWYGVNFDTDFDTRHMEDCGKLECACGTNHWERVGIFRFRDVEPGEAGRWYLKRTIDHNLGGTVPRPTIRALEAHREDQSYDDSYTGRQVSQSNGPSWQHR